MERHSSLAASNPGNVLLLFVVDDALGAGIDALVGVVAGRVGGAIWSAFALPLAVFTAFAYRDSWVHGRRRATRASG